MTEPETHVWHCYEVVSGEGDDVGISFSVETLERDALPRAGYWARRPGYRIRKVRYEQPVVETTRTVVEDPVEWCDI
jgi:hypothetical protein